MMPPAIDKLLRKGSATSKLTTKLARVVVPPHVRVVDGKTQHVEGYTYDRRGGVELPAGYTTSYGPAPMKRRMTANPDQRLPTQKLTVKNERGQVVAEVEYATADYTEIHQIDVPEEFRGRHLAEAAISELHKHTGKPILHGSFSMPGGAALGFDMARDFPEWNKVWIDFTEDDTGKRKLILWEPGTPIDPSWKTFSIWAPTSQAENFKAIAAKYGKPKSATSKLTAKLARVYVPARWVGGRMSVILMLARNAEEGG